MISVLGPVFCCLLVAGTATPTNRQDQHTLQAQESNYFFNAAFDRFVEETLEEYKVPGFSIAVIDGDEVQSKV